MGALLQLRKVGAGSRYVGGGLRIGRPDADIRALGLARVQSTSNTGRRTSHLQSRLNLRTGAVVEFGGARITCTMRKLRAFFGIKIAIITSVRCDTSSLFLRGCVP